MTHKIPPWSYSSLTAFETCPRRYFLTRVSKEVVENETDATRWGTYVHTALEYRLRDGTPLPVDLSGYEKYAARIAAAPGQLLVEHEVALTENFKPTQWRSSDAWVRGIIDVAVVNGAQASALDWKTGKRKSDSEQLKLFAGMSFAEHEAVDTVKTSFLWLKVGKVDQDQFTRKDIPAIWMTFLPRVERLHNAYERDAWPPRPSGLCRAYCNVGKRLCTYCGS